MKDLKKKAVQRNEQQEQGIQHERLYRGMTTATRIVQRGERKREMDSRDAEKTKRGSLY